jgi:hypothetical protein
MLIDLMAGLGVGLVVGAVSALVIITWGTGLASDVLGRERFQAMGEVAARRTMALLLFVASLVFGVLSGLIFFLVRAHFGVNSKAIFLTIAALAAILLTVQATGAQQEEKAVGVRVLLNILWALGFGLLLPLMAIRLAGS